MSVSISSATARNALNVALACPRCRHRLQRLSPGWRCSSCDAAFTITDGVVDFAPEIARSSGLGQRVMEMPAVSQIYEKTFRPWFTRLGSTIRYHDEERFLSAWFKPADADAPVLDLACGSGRYLRRLAGLAPRNPVFGLDLSAAMLGTANRSLADFAPRVALVRGSAQALPFGDASLAAVNCFGALHLFPNPASAVAEVGRCLRPGGSFTCLTARAVSGGGAAQLQRLFSRLASFRFFAPGELARDLHGAGLALLEEQHREMVVLLAARKG